MHTNRRRAKSSFVFLRSTPPAPGPPSGAGSGSRSGHPRRPPRLQVEAHVVQHHPARRIVGLEVSWPSVERLYDRVGMAPQLPAGTSRAAVPVYKGGRQVGRATTTGWSPTLKKLIALATIDAPHAAEGSELDFEVTIEGTRLQVPATVAKTPFFNPQRKTSVPTLKRNHQ